MKEKKIRRRILDAADYIDRHGWTTGQLRDQTGQVCVLGAIHAVTPRTRRFLIGDYGWRYDHPIIRYVAAQLVRDRLSPTNGTSASGAIADANDTFVFRSTDEVVRYLRRVGHGGPDPDAVPMQLPGLPRPRVMPDRELRLRMDRQPDGDDGAAAGSGVEVDRAVVRGDHHALADAIQAYSQLVESPCDETIRHPAALDRLPALAADAAVAR